MNVSFLLAGLCLLSVSSLTHAGLGTTSCTQDWIITGECTDCVDSNISNCFPLNDGQVCCDRPDVSSGGITNPECDAILMLDTTFQTELMGCLATPLNLFELNKYRNISTDQDYSQFICPSMKIALQCMEHYLLPMNASYGSACSIQYLYGAARYIMGQRFPTLMAHATVSGILDGCFGTYSYQDTCTDPPSSIIDFRTAIFSYCAKGLMDTLTYASDMQDLQCISFASCSYRVKEGYKLITPCTSLVVDEVYMDATTNSQLLSDLQARTGFDFAMTCNQDQTNSKDCLLPIESGWEGIVACLQTPAAVLNSSDLVDFSSHPEVVCQSYINAVVCSRNILQYFPHLVNLTDYTAGVCSFTDVYHPLFLDYLQFVANMANAANVANGQTALSLSSQDFNTASCVQSVLTYEPACPNAVEVKTAIFAFCSEGIVLAPNQIFKCAYAGGCIEGLKLAYNIEAGKFSCDSDSVFDAVTSDPTAIEEFKTLSGLDMRTCAMVDCRNVTQVFVEVMSGKAQDCTNTFILVLTSPDFPTFCENLWSGLQCAAEKIHNDEESCLNSMKREIQRDTAQIYNVMAGYLGVETISGIRNRLLSAGTCPQAIIERDIGQVASYLRQCAMLGDMMINAVQSCVTRSFTNSSLSDCMRFDRSARCIAGKLVMAPQVSKASKIYEHMLGQCIELMMDTMEDYRPQLESTLGDLSPRECMRMRKVCGENLWPLAQKCRASSGNSNCPTNYTCEVGEFCCPMKRPGMCPKMSDDRLCVITNACTKDMDCGLGKKCCHQGCGYKTCTDIELRAKSMCEMSFDRFKDKIISQRVCGDNTGVVQVPHCQNNKYGPIQGDVASGVMYCATEDGRKIVNSEFRGNVNCPKTRPGKCPDMPPVCMGKTRDEIIRRDDNDHECNAGQKACYTNEQNACVKKCVDVMAGSLTQDARFDVCPEGVQRQCCPADACDTAKCPAKPSAVCRANPCGECSVEFYDEHNQLVNCTEGLSMCHHKRAMAQMMNRKMGKTYSKAVIDFIRSREVVPMSMMDDDMDMGMGNYDSEEMRLVLDRDMMEDMQEKYKEMNEIRDEYGMMARAIEKMETEERMYEIGIAMQRMSDYMAKMAAAMCMYFTRHGICQNKGTCIIGTDPMQYLKVCKCEDGFYGLFCEKTGNPTPNSDCGRYKAIVDGIWDRTNDYGMHGHVVHRLLTLFRVNYDLMPIVTCSNSGLYEQIQHVVMLPYTPTSRKVQICVDPDTGMRRSGTLLALEGESLNCSTWVEPDVLELPRSCRLQPNGVCPEGQFCSEQYFFNSVSRMCEKSSRPGNYGYNTLSQCYMECGFQYLAKCPTYESDELGICSYCANNDACPPGQRCCPAPCGMTCVTPTAHLYIPKPCEQMTGCDWGTHYCHVNSSGHGMCKPFKDYCWQLKDPGTGDKQIGAYYFNRDVRRCDKFIYKGHGGNMNRFYNLHQCQMECGEYSDYKFNYPVCPPPQMLMAMENNNNNDDMMMMTTPNTCHNDYDCGADHVCCSDGTQGVCTSPIGMCGSVRCSPFARCENDMCVCPTCDGEEMNEVCGDNGHRFDNLCMLRKYACERMMNITVQTCPTMPMAPAATECPMACTLEYMPICTIDLTDGGSTIGQASNACELRSKRLCENKDIRPLYMGQCENDTKCGGNCEPFESCMNGQCTCQEACPKDYNPVCAAPRPFITATGTSQKMTFSNVCEMRAYGCQQRVIMVILSHGPCEPKEPEYECPATRMDIPRSAETLCDMETNANCGEGFKCCPYGAGARCIPMVYVKRKMMERPGFCPIKSYINYNRDDCWKKELMCEDDSDVPDNVKCCDNLVCMHKTPAAPIGLDGEQLCGVGKRPIPLMRCNAAGDNHACPMGSMCTSGMTKEGIKLDVCCEDATTTDPRTDMMAVYGNRLCNIVEGLGQDMICQNGGRCIGDVKHGQMCECPQGYYGAFCEIQMTDEPLCRRLSSIFSTVFGLVREMGNPEGHSDEQQPPMRKKRDGHGSGGIEDDDHDDGDDNEMYMYLADPSILALRTVMMKMGYTHLPHDGMLRCETDGSFMKKQCFEALEDEGKDFCGCVKPMTGMNIMNGPKAETLDKLDCNLVSSHDLPEFCLMSPSNGTCTGDESERWYFCSMQQECIKYMDRGCNPNVKNSFPTWASCTAMCGGKTARAEKCMDLNCAAGSVCRKVMGTLRCVDVRTVGLVQEYPEPTCEENGDYSPMQCQGDTCRCVQRDGTLVANSFGTAENLKCTRNEMGETMASIPESSQTKTCPNGAQISICEEPGNPCNNCQRPSMNDNMNGGNMGGNMMSNMHKDPKVQDDGTCKDCQICPADQGRQTCTNSCEDAPGCKQFPGAICKVDKCTCALNYYKSGNQMVNCNAAQSQCEKAKMALEMENATRALQNRIMGAMQMNNVDELRCSPAGGFYAICAMSGNNRMCYCLNATDGMRVGPGVSGVTVGSLQCTETQRQTIAKRFRGLMKIADIPLSELTQAQRTQIVALYRNWMEGKYNIKIVFMQLVSGSVNLEYEAEVDETSTVASGTTDVASLSAVVHADIMEEEFLVGDNLFKAQEATVLEFLTEEDIPTTTTARPTEGDDDNTGLIIGLVVGGVALLLIIVAIIVICNRNKKSKSSSMQFSDLQGKDNPTYPYKA